MKLPVEALLNLTSRLDSLVTGATKLGVAYAGYRANGHWTGALTGLVALRLAEGGNLAGGAAGLGTLALIGVANVPQIVQPITDLATTVVSVPGTVIGGVNAYIQKILSFLAG
ncbi:unnamed protein product [marine sediment metagenome]|uniref:Uncharacterized protein n=1 Tax=marine sediment metagenome TaxID=412755 RepID=X1A9L4_9ZZZZ